jgi:ATP-dependent Clp protease ATP-binding subunit ClpX
VITSLDDLNEDSLKQILTTPKNALIKQYKKLFEMENVELEFLDEALTEIVKQAIKRKTGARGLRAILEKILLNTMFDLPSSSNIRKVVIDKDTVLAKKQPLLVYEEKKRSKTS